jgi:hypothetical protein
MRGAASTVVEDAVPVTAFGDANAGESRPESRMVDRSEGFGERLLGVLLDRAHEMPPQLIAPMIAEEVARIGVRCRDDDWWSVSPK